MIIRKSQKTKPSTRILIPMLTAILVLSSTATLASSVAYDMAKIAINLAGGTAVDEVFGDDGYDEVMNQMNEDIDAIQGDISYIKTVLSTLREDTLNDMLTVMSIEQHQDIRDFISHSKVVFTSYSHDATTELEFDDTEADLREAINIYINRNFSESDSVGSASEFIYMAELHLAFIAKQINDGKLSSCPVGQCENRIYNLEVSMNRYHEQVALYVNEIQRIGEALKSYRMDQIQLLRIKQYDVIDEHRRIDNETYCASGTYVRDCKTAYDCEFKLKQCNEEASYFQGKYLFYAVDKAEGSKPQQNIGAWLPFLIGGGAIESDEISDGIEAFIDMDSNNRQGSLLFAVGFQGAEIDSEFNDFYLAHREEVEIEINDSVDAILDPITTALDDSSNQFIYIDGAIISGCAAFYKADMTADEFNENGDSGNDYKLICGTTKYKSLDSYNISFFGNTIVRNIWGADWLDSISTIKLGEGTTLKLFTDEYYKGEKFVLYGDDFSGYYNSHIRLSDVDSIQRAMDTNSYIPDFENDVESIKLIMNN
jgi:hypothetical protein